MKFTKRVSCLALCAVTIFTLSIPAFAISKSAGAGAYGTLKATLTGGSKPTYSTTVTRNPDNAYLTYKVEYLNKTGKTLATSSSRDQGVVKISGSRSSKPSGTYSIYGTHGVQGGSKYGAAAIYTKVVV